jgi:glycosyltransferase involved in cell wall biosynthesis
MKIAWLNEHLLYWNGGVKYINDVCRQLKERGYIVDLLVSKVSLENKKRFVGVIEFSGIAANNLLYWIFYPIILIINAFKLKKLLKEYDIAISSSPTTNLLCWMCQKQYIAVCFELNPWIYNKEFISGLSFLKKMIIWSAGFLIKIVDRLAFRYAKKVIVWSNFVKVQVDIAYNINSKVVYTGVDPEMFYFDGDLSLFKQYENRKVILHVATYLSPIKGTIYAIRSMQSILKKVPDAYLIILNSQNNVPEQAELMDLAHSIGVADSVKFIPYVHPEQVRLYYSLAYVLLQPSLDENVHWPVIEAAYCQCPTIGFQGTLPSEDIIDGRTGYLVPLYDVDAMAKKSIEVLEDCKLMELLGKNASRYAMDKFSWQKCIDSYETTIRSI